MYWIPWSLSEFVPCTNSLFDFLTFLDSIEPVWDWQSMTDWQSWMSTRVLMISILGLIPIRGNFIFCWNFLKPLNVNFLYKNARNAGFVGKTKTSNKSSQTIIWRILHARQHRYFPGVVVKKIFLLQLLSRSFSDVNGTKNLLRCSSGNIYFLLLLLLSER